MNNQQLHQFLVDIASDAGYDLPRSANNWSQYVEESGALDYVLDDLDKYLPTWDRLSPETFEERVVNLDIPDYKGVKLETLYSRWSNMLVPF